MNWKVILILVVISSIIGSGIISLTYFLFYFCFDCVDEEHYNKNDDSQNETLIKRNEFRDKIKKLNPEILEIKESNNRKLKAYFFKQGINNNKLVILCHGWRGEALRDLHSYGEFYFNHHEYDLLVLVHEGHYPSEGKFIGFGVKDGENIKLWIEMINQKFNSQYDIYLHGISMGATACLFACKHQLPKNVKGIVADSGFTSGYEELLYLMKKKYRSPRFPTLFLVRCIVKHRMKYDIKTNNTIDAINLDSIPILLIHGDQDDFVPTSMSIKNFEEYLGPKELWIVKGAWHVKSYVQNKIEYEERVIAFFEKHN